MLDEEVYITDRDAEDSYSEKIVKPSERKHLTFHICVEEDAQ